MLCKKRGGWDVLAKVMAGMEQKRWNAWALHLLGCGAVAVLRALAGLACLCRVRG